MLFAAVIESVYVDNREVIVDVVTAKEDCRGVYRIHPFLGNLCVLFKGEISSFVRKITLLIKLGFHIYPPRIY
jgi:hypothetical protein